MNAIVSIVESRVEIINDEIASLAIDLSRLYTEYETDAQIRAEVHELQVELAQLNAELKTLTKDVLPRAKRGLPVTLTGTDWE